MARGELSGRATLDRARLPFAGQIAFFRAKLGNLVPTARWDDLWKSAHDSAFMVAGAAKADLLADLAAAVDRAISEGAGLEAFRKDFEAAVKKHDWHGWTGEGSAKGRAWRTRIIYQTNLLTSYNAGRFAQLKAAGFRYWIYRHNDSVRHPRPQHVAWSGLTLPPDHPFWRTHYPPNGWLCHCYVIGTNNPERARRLGADPDKQPPDGWDAIDAKTGEPVGIDKGWGYAPGASVADRVSALAPKLGRLPARLVSDWLAASTPALREAWRGFVDEVLADPVPRGRMAMLGAMSLEDMAFLDAQGRPPARADLTIEDRLLVGKKARRHEQAGDALSPEEWRALAEYLNAPEAVLFDRETGNLLYVFPAADGRKGKIVVNPDFWHKPTKQSLASVRTVFKLGADALMNPNRYAVIRGEVRK